jgi:hypothetical protein
LLTCWPFAQDFIYLPVILKDVPFTPLDVLFLDEAQDLSVARSALVIRLVAPTGLIIAVGDPKQSINGFTGTIPDAMDHLDSLVVKEFVDYGLPVSRRCPVAHVDAVEAYFGAKKDRIDIRHRPGAPLGTIVYENVLYAASTDGDRRLAETFLPGTLVISRKNDALEKLSVKLAELGTQI